MIELLNMDCMDYMQECEDNAFDLAIVDPPYGISANRMYMGDGYVNGRTVKKRWSARSNMSQGGGKLANRTLNKMGAAWDESPPTKEYFDELFRVSQNQVIWGGNYFDLPPTRCVLCWDKEQPWENFSQWEMAWTSFSSPAALFKRQNGIREPGKIHPTQKPLKLYQWILRRYSEPKHKILDTFMGTGTTAIAAHYFGVDFVGMDIDEDYYKAAKQRIDMETRQQALI